MIVFGPATIQHGSNDLGKTSGGGSLALLYHSYVGLSSGKMQRRCYGGTGTLKLFSLSSTVNIIDSLQFTNYGILTITGTTEVFVITLYSCKLFFPDNLSFGTFTQQTFDVTFHFKRNDAGLIYTIS